MSAPLPPDEPERLALLRALDVLDTAPEQDFDDLVLLAAAICDTPVAVMNLIDADRQWGKALAGLQTSEAPREESMCARTIATEDGTFVIPDVARDATFRGGLFHRDGVRFYAGAALEVDGHRLGTICVADTVPRKLTPTQLDGLRALARQAAAQLQLRRRTRELEATNDALRRLALHDALTGLPNRVVLEDRLATALARRRRTGRALAVVFCDLDGFKAINDEHGHEAGDNVLRAFAARLEGAARETDTVARLAGDEFVLVCEDLARGSQAAMVTARLLQAVAGDVLVGGRLVPLDVSIGVALAERDDTPRTLLRRADAAMYAAKDAARRDAAA